MTGVQTCALPICMAMAALGINVNFKAIASKGKKPMLASFLTSILLMCFAAGVAMLFF